MDQSTLVENRVDDGRRFVQRFATDGHQVVAAFWVKTAEEGLWFLYIASEIVDREGPAAAYRAVHDSLQKHGDTWIASSEIKVVSPRNPIVKDVLSIMDRYPGRSSMRYGGTLLGSLEVEHVYIYPSNVFTISQVLPMTTEEVSQAILRLMNRGPGVLQPSCITLKNGATFSGVPFSFQYGNQNAIMVSFIAEKDAPPQVVPLDEISSNL